MSCERPPALNLGAPAADRYTSPAPSAPTSRARRKSITIIDHLVETNNASQINKEKSKKLKNLKD